MTVQEYLGQLKDMRDEIQDMEELKQEYIEKAMSTSTSYEGEKVQTSRKDNSKMERYTVLAADLDNKIADKETQYYKCMLKITKQIRGSYNCDYIKVLHKVYIQFRSLNQAAKELKMSYPRCVKVHDEALVEFRQRCGKKRVKANGSENKNVDE